VFVFFFDVYIKPLGKRFILHSTKPEVQASQGATNFQRRYASLCMSNARKKKAQNYWDDVGGQSSG
jgi:hypothetical protein